MATISLPHIYQARDYQMDFWDAFHSVGKHAGKKYKIFVKVWHRRAGKDMTDWNAAIERTAEQPMTCKYAFPTNDMARENLWESITNDDFQFTDFVPKSLRLRRNSRDDGLNHTLKRIKLITGGSIRVISAHKPGSLRGGNSKIFVLSEFQAMDPIVIDIIMPIIEANGGILLINMTANGDSAAKVLLEGWIDDPDVYVSILTANDTPVFTPEQLIRIRRDTIKRFEARGLSAEEGNAFVDQEYFCSWESPVIGSYFGGAMRTAEKQGRITRVLHEPDLPVHTYWDLGIDDSMTIWFVQFLGREIRVIDYFEASGEGIPYYARVLKGQHEGYERMAEYMYGTHYAPHDIEVRELTTGVSRKDTAKTLGIKFKTVHRPTRKQDGIDASRKTIPRCYFDKENCKRGISALKGYRKEWNDKMQVYSDQPVHDWTSHGADGFQTLALSNPQELTGQEGGRVIRAKTHANPRVPTKSTTTLDAQGRTVLNLDFRRAYGRRRR
jgi:phage terminase large subunit